MRKATMETGGLRIGELAERTGTTARTIRYYEEFGLLPRVPDRDAGQHRLYGEADVARLRELLRLKELLGLSLDELREIVTAEEARDALREEWHRGDASTERREEILAEALTHIERQLDLLHRRREKLDDLERELTERRALVRRRMREL